MITYSTCECIMKQFFGLSKCSACVYLVRHFKPVQTGLFFDLLDRGGGGGAPEAPPI